MAAADTPRADGSAATATKRPRPAKPAVPPPELVDRLVKDAMQIDDEALLSYNGMLTSTFELIADAQEGLASRLSAAEAKRDYWLAETDATAAIWGGAITLTGGSEE